MSLIFIIFCIIPILITFLSVLFFVFQFLRIKNLLNSSYEKLKTGNSTKPMKPQRENNRTHFEDAEFRRA